MRKLNVWLACAVVGAVVACEWYSRRRSVRRSVEKGREWYDRDLTAELRRRLDDAERRELAGQPQEDVDMAALRWAIEGDSQPPDTGGDS